MEGKTLGEVIRNARVALGHSLRALAAMLDVTPSYLSDIENDRRIPAEAVLSRIAYLLGLDTDALMVMAGRFGESAEQYMRRQPEAIRLFRKISEANLGEDQLRALQHRVENEHGKNP